MTGGATRSFVGRLWMEKVVAPLAVRLIDYAQRREPDFIIGGHEAPYLRRWYLTPWRRVASTAPKGSLLQRLAQALPNIYLHQFLRSDDDRALHDHPWVNCSVLLRGFYTEHTIAQGGVNHARSYAPGNVKLRRSSAAHRIEIADGAECWTLFITGPVIREWGFHCPRGWRHWKEFVDERDSGQVGRGCA